MSDHREAAEGETDAESRFVRAAHAREFIEDAFLIVGLLSIDPTIRYIRWNKTLKENKAPEISDKEFKRTRVILWLEVIGLAVVMLAAAFMARGIGLN